MSATQAQVSAFVAACQKAGFTWTVRSESVLTIERRFAPNDGEAFVACDMYAPHVLGLAPLRGGSVWGTDGGSVGGYVGLTNGHFVMNKSGQGSRFMKALAKVVS